MAEGSSEPRQTCWAVIVQRYDASAQHFHVESFWEGGKRSRQLFSFNVMRELDAEWGHAMAAVSSSKRWIAFAASQGVSVFDRETGGTRLVAAAESLRPVAPIDISAFRNQPYRSGPLHWSHGEHAVTQIEVDSGTVPHCLVAAGFPPWSQGI
ncbi:MAG: hypothetical protein EXR52_07975 [Dehalococcoidia bacterium]|nr:hypothetical protein [Dehalococcoidia bacterium]